MQLPAQDGSSSSTEVSTIEAYVPLIQTFIWVVGVLLVALIFRKQIVALRDSIDKRLTEGTAFKLGPLEFSELRQRVQRVEHNVDNLQERVSNLFLLSMSGPMYRNLRKLATGRFGPYEKSDALARELRNLRDQGYIEVWSIREVPKTGDELSEHVKVTEMGREFVSLREMIAASPPT